VSHATQYLVPRNWVRHMSPMSREADTFPELEPGTPVWWDLALAPNAAIEPSETPQAFEVDLKIRGDGSSLDQRSVFFVIPLIIESL